MTVAEESIKKHCQSCRQEQVVRLQFMGDKTLMRCIECSNWIHCPDCQHIMAVDHNCPRKVIEVPS